MADAEQFINWVTGFPLALRDAVNSYFGAGYPGLVPPPTDPLNPLFYLNENGWQQVQYAQISGTPTVIPQTNIQGTRKNLSIVTAASLIIGFTIDEIVLEEQTTFETIRIRSIVGGGINYSTNGINGLDTGSVAANTWYYHWVMYNPSNGAVGYLGSLSSTAPTLPAGYTYKARIGAGRTDATPNFIPSIQKDTWVQWLADRSVIAGTQVYGPNSMVAFVPVTAIRAFFILTVNNNQVSIGTNATGNRGLVQGIAVQAKFAYDFMLESTNIYYSSNSAGGQLVTTGYVDML